MKLLYSILGVGLILAGFCGATAGEAAASHGPRLVCDQPVYNFGTNNTEKPISHTFILRNAGDEPLTIRKTHAACGCAKMGLTTNTILPGKTAELSIVLSLHGRSGPARKAITLESNDPQKPLSKVEFVGTFIVDVEVIPQIISFGTRAPGDSGERYADITTSSNVTFQVTGLKLDSTQFTASIETNVVGKQYRLRVRVKPDTPGGKFETVAHVLTDHPRYPDISVSLVQFVSEDIVAVPRTLKFSQPVGGSSPPRYVTLISRANKPFAITDVTPPCPDMRFQVQTNGPARYRIEFSGGTITSNLNGAAIQVTTDRTGLNPITIPVEF